MKSISLVTVMVCIVTAGVAQPSRIPPPPPFAPGTTTDIVQGVEIADPFRALENSGDPKVQAWSDAQNTRTRTYLDSLPGRAAIAAKVARFLHATSPRFSDLQAKGPYVFGFYADPKAQQPALVTLNQEADPASRRAVLDPNTLDRTGTTTIDWYVASPDGAKVAVSLSKNGSEEGTLHVYDVATGKEIDAPIPRVQFATAGGAVAWTADGSAFWYTRYPDVTAPEGERAFNQALYLHQVGAERATDRLVLSARNGLPRTAEIYLDASGGGGSAIASVELGDGGKYQHYVLTPDGTALQISHYADGVIGGAVIDRRGSVYGVSRLAAPLGKVLKLSPPYTGGFAAARVIVPEQKDAAIINGGEKSYPLVLSADHVFVSRIAGGPSEVSVYNLDGGGGKVLSLPPISAVDEIDPLPDGGAVFSVATFLEPPYFMRWNARDASVSRTGLAMTSPISFADAQVTRITATSKDGTKVPISVISRKGVKLDGSHPVLLTGYGGYGLSETPYFAGRWTRLWLDAGGIYADANIRGGNEYGESWHQAGMLTKKQNVFDDFAAAGEAMIHLGYTRHEKLALTGGSNGGLLMGAMITQHPGLAKAVVSRVGIYDMIRNENDPNGAFNITEFGTVKDPAQFKALYAYSPYHHVQPGTAYPAVLMTTGAMDGRVNPMQSRKFTAALQAATSSGRPILLRTSRNAGHGTGSSQDELIAEGVDREMFLFDQLGMSAADAAR